jgi:hypothetical protein
LTGCGVQGFPQPPSLELPQPPKDLAAVRKGDKVTLTWTQPKETTDKEAARHLGPTRICRLIANTLTPHPMTGCPSVGQVPPQPVARDHTGPQPTLSFIAELSPDLQSASPQGSAEFAVQALNRRGRGAGLSNQVSVPLAPTLPPPNDLASSVAADGVHITATPSQAPPQITGLKFTYRLYRIGVPAQPKEAPVVAAEIPAGGEDKLQFNDSSFAWEQKYSYYIDSATAVLSPAGATQATVEGENSAAITVQPHDIFPPATPTGLQAVFSGLEAQKFIDLTWNANTESDLAGYNVYRHESAAEPVKINSALAKTPAFRDSNVAAGHTYFYSVTAVDLRNNESPRSAETSETVPPQ